MTNELALPKYGITHPLLREMAIGMAAIFSATELLGFYLGGSIALGGFNPETSDLDFIVVTEAAQTPKQLQNLKDLHAELWEKNTNTLFRKHEGDYITRHQALHPTRGIVAPHVGREGHFEVEEHGSELIIDLWKVRKAGFVVLGPPPQELIGAITDEQMLAAKVDLFNGWWLPKLEGRKPMGSGYQVYAVLTMGRILYGVHIRGEVSKREAASWMVGAFPEFAGLVRDAAKWQSGETFDRQQEVFALIEFVSKSVNSNSDAGTG